MIIRAAIKDDLQTCEELLKIPEFELASGGYVDASLLEHFLDENYFLVAEEHGKVIACIVADPTNAGILMIWFLVVEPNMRGKGIGRKLLVELESRCKKSVNDWIVLYAPFSNKDTLEFYKKQSYNQGKLFVEFTKKL